MRKEYVYLTALIAAVVIATLIYFGMSYTGFKQEKTLVIYTYGSLLAWGPNKNATYAKVFGGFEKKYGVKVKLVKFPDTGSMLAKLISDEESGKVVADVVVGLDNLQVIKAKEAGVLEPYTPPNIDEIPQWLLNAYDPQHYAIPYDYGLIAFILDTKYLNESVASNLTFTSFLKEPLRNSLVTEDPRTSSVGLSFLLYEITVYSKYYHEDWRTWWSEVKPAIKSSWDAAYDAFDKGQYHVMVSYATDPAYSMYFYNSTRYVAALPKVGGKMLGWVQIEGLGIVKGCKHPELAKKFVQWFISKDVQEEIPLNNWMYPANKDVKLPECFKYAIKMGDVEVVNLNTTQSELEKHIDEWVNEWVNIMGSS